jgi:hypothetical protein
MMFVGILWAMFAPVLLAPVIVGLAYAMRRLGWTPALALAAAIVLVPLGGIYWMDRTAFRETCREVGEPVILSRAVADGIYLNSGTANSFGTRYVTSEGFAWMERRDIYDRDAFVRVTRSADGKFTEKKIERLSARYEVVETFEQREPDLGISWIRVVDRQTGDEMARAGSATFGGGRAGLVLGAYGVASCPDAASASDAFDRYYHLARDTLRPE